MLAQRFELQGRRFTNFHYYYSFAIGHGPLPKDELVFVQPAGFCIAGFVWSPACLLNEKQEWGCGSVCSAQDVLGVYCVTWFRCACYKWMKHVLFLLSVFRRTRRCGATAQHRPLSTAGCWSTVATCWPSKTSRWRRCWPSSPWASTCTCRTCETLTSLMPRWEW